MVSSLLTVSLSLSLALSGLTKDLEDCADEVRKNPRDYDAARCFHVAAARRNQDKETRDKAREQTLSAIQALEQEHKDARYLDIVRGHLYWVDDPEQAASLYQEAASRYERMQDPLGAVIAHANAAQLLFWRLHRPEDAQEAMDAVEEIAQTVEDPKVKARAVVLLASYACDVGDRIGTALELLNRFGEEQIKQSPYSLSREILLSRSTCSLHALDFEQTDRDLHLIQGIAKANQDQSTESMASYRLAYASLHKLDTDATWVEQERPNTIQRFHDALAVARKVHEPEQEVRALSNLSILLAGQPERVERAIALANECLEVAQKTGREEHAAFCNSARSQALRAKDPRRANALATGLLQALPKVGQTRARIKFLRYAMRRSWAINPPELSVQIASRVLEAIEHDREAQRATLARQKIFAAWTQDYYWLSYRLFELGKKDSKYLEQAFEVLERSRARVLREQMSNKLADPEGSAKADKQSQLVFTALKRFKDARGIWPMNTKNAPRLAEVSTSMAKVQAQLEAQEAMLLYQTAPEQTFDGETLGGAWVLLLTKDKAIPVQLPTHLKVLRNAVGVMRDLIRNNDEGSKAAAQRLRTLIFEPVLQSIPSEIQSLIIVPDGPLHALPFSAIAQDYEHSVAPSATVWSEIRSTRHALLAPKGMSLVNPLRRGARENTGVTERSAKAETPEDYRPLPASRREAKAIQKFLGQGVRVLQGANATPLRLTDAWSRTDRLLHISAHSDVKVQEPSESSLLLSNMDSDEDGRLSVEEIVQMPAKDAVVVLAGCATGWGTLLAGEGMLSLARAFQRAGATAVVASLWPIEDERSADFFERFYGELGQGKSVSQALNLVQASMKRDGYAHSSYEGFVVLGDGSVRFSIDQAELARAQWLPWSGLGLVGGLGVWWMLRRRRRKQS